ncbi:Uu.00g123940.m01.CDS01 [Anthostomella pinea]|uniref:Uu.00g123940.m01.CDS01 n=1 Tax=Anthostomella pinea TaxID=933095 RepID=A0AAI8VHH5_9PEZI|nr:Uu.00g123940.m01.CDS01 [Anthostomella pinea]
MARPEQAVPVLEQIYRPRLSGVKPIPIRSRTSSSYELSLDRQRANPRAKAMSHDVGQFVLDVGEQKFTPTRDMLDRTQTSYRFSPAAETRLASPTFDVPKARDYAAVLDGGARARQRSG